MKKLQMCRICLAKNVLMYVVVNKNLHELYEKLTDIPFVTEDKRPILACFCCCAKLKQSFRLMRKCLEAEELFAQMMDEDYEPNPSINPEHLGFRSGFIRTPIEHISIVDKCQTESIAIKEEPADCEGLDDTKGNLSDESIDIKEELPAVCDRLYDVKEDQSNVIAKEQLRYGSDKRATRNNNKLTRREKCRRHVCALWDVFYEEGVLSDCKRSVNLEPENVDNSYQDVKAKPADHSESDSEGDVPLIVFKTEGVEAIEVSKKIRRAVVTNKCRNKQTSEMRLHKKRMAERRRKARIRSNPEQAETLRRRDRERYHRKKREGARATRTIQLEDTITAELKIKEPSNLKVFRATGNRTSKPGTSSEEPDECDQRICKKTYKCDVCRRSFNLKCDLKAHIRVHTGEKPYKCGICQRSFRQSNHLRKHIRIHTGEKPYKCDVCQRSFSESGSLTKHIRIHTGEKPFKCDVCPRSFIGSEGLRNHIRVHTGEKPYKCDVCQRGFSESGSLRKHFIRIHTGEKPYKCDVCPRTFSERSSLRRHFQIHTGEKPYNCDVCQRSFSQRIELTKHLRIHTGEKPYKCDVCERSFTLKGTLTKHIRTHTGEKPYKCDVCERSFIQKTSLNNHILKHTAAKSQ